MGFFEKLKSGLTKTRQNFTNRITELVGMSAKVDEDFLEELDTALVSCACTVDRHKNATASDNTLNRFFFIVYIFVILFIFPDRMGSE